jgi:uncharacterized OB-fold protein
MTQAKPGKKQVPVRRGRFKIPEQPGSQPYLIASRCQNCGKYFFPTRVICLNCGKQTLEETPLKGKGILYTYTIARQQLPGALTKPPYAIANITMEEGCQVPTVVTEGWDSLDIGMEMEVYFEKIQEDAEGNDQIVYKFRRAKKK